MKAIWKQLLLIFALCFGILCAGYKMGEINTESRINENLEALYSYVDSTTPMADFRRYTKLSTAAMAIEWAKGGIRWRPSHDPSSPHPPLASGSGA